MKNSFKSIMTKVGTISASALMALSICAPALSTSASRRPIRHERAAKKVRLTKSQKALLHKDERLAKKIRGKINRDVKLLHAKNARALNHQLRKHGYNYKQRIAILAVVNREVAGTFHNENDKRAFGYFGFVRGAGYRGLRRYAHKHHESKYSIITQLNYLSHKSNKRRAFSTRKGSIQWLMKVLDRDYLQIPLHQSNRRYNHQIHVTKHVLYHVY